MQDLETILQDALEDSAVNHSLVLVPRHAVVTLRDKLRSERQIAESADSLFTECERTIFDALWARKGQIVDRRELISADKIPRYSALRVHVERMRRKIEADRLPVEIISKMGQGYMVREVRNG